MKNKFLIAGGGTGGHIYPGVAIARALMIENKNIEVEFVGSSMGLESKIIPREGFKLHLISSGQLNYKGSFLSKISGFFKAVLGLAEALILLQKIKPCGVLGVGGYASGPLVLIASLLNIPTLIWEPNAHPGLTNRWLSRFVQKSLIVFDGARHLLKSKEIILVGLPVRKVLENIMDRDNDTKFHVLCFGGSQGSRILNEALEQSVTKEAEWLKNSHLIHQTGVNDFQKINKIYMNSNLKVEALEYLFEMEKYYSWADIVICRSGASTIAELEAVGKPAVLIPLPTAADDHQRKNAIALVDRHAAILLEQKNLSIESLNSIVIQLQNNSAILKEMKDNLKALYKPNAAETIAQIINEQIKKHS